MKIVFITPTTSLRRFPLYRFASRFYGHPNSITGPLILGTLLKQAGHDVEVYEELNGRVPYEKLFQTTDVFCFSIMTSTSVRAYELADKIHEQTKARVIIGGIHATAMPYEALEHADQVITGEGEHVIVDVIEGRRSESIVTGISVEHLDEVVFPDYSILKTPCDTANILSTRGCTHCCTFCTTSRMFAPYRQRSVDSVIEEIRYYKQQGFRYINFEDDNFTADKERAKEICRRMIEENLLFREIFFFGRTDMAQDEELLELLSRAHLNRVLIGIESLNQSGQEWIHKGQNISDIEKAAKACRRHKIRLIASLVLGLDTDTANDIRRGVAFAKEMHAYQLQPAILTPYPGTPVYEQFHQEQRMIVDNWEWYDMMNVTFIPLHMTPWELQNEFYRAVRSFYNFPSALQIGKIFGLEFGIRRLGLMVFAWIGSGAATALSLIGRNTPYYALRHFQTEDTKETTSLSTVQPRH
jgi:radical SAM superfamily enzyme YgiQ (UPF0313 family)